MADNIEEEEEGEEEAAAGVDTSVELNPAKMTTTTTELNSTGKEEQEESFKISGYLEKRSKVSYLGWRRYWFVLDGRLLTYYKSKADYEGLTAFSGSVNLGIATNVSPMKSTKGFPFQIVTRSQVFYLRASTKAELDKWVVALQEAVAIPPNISGPIWSDPGIQFYRYEFSSATAQSQWSLDNSTEELSSVRRLPLNFYRPTSLLKKCHSFSALNFIGSKSNLKHAGSRDYLDQLWDNYGTYSSTLDFDRKNKKVKEMQETVPKARGGTRMRHTTSMLFLQSSPEATALRNELGRKLSFQNAANKPCTAPREHHQLETDEEMYINCQSESSHHHEYDEINDITCSIYEPCGEDSKSSAGSESIYENIDSNQSPRNTRAIFEDPWEKLPLPQNGRSFEIKRNSRGSGRNSLNSIAEVPEKEPTSPRSSPYELDEPVEQMSDDSGSWDRKGKLKLRIINRSQSISTFFHKIFNKNDRRKKEKSRAMVITGPVDLRTTCHKDSEKLGGSDRIRPHNRPGLHPAIGLTSSQRNSQELLQELNQKIDQRRKSSKGDSSESLKSLSKSQAEKSPLSRENSPTSSEVKGHEESPPKHVPELPKAQSINNRHENGNEYQTKLDRFNRLSASLNPSFLAAINQQKAAATGTSKINRSQSCRMRHVEEPPVLPPKRKQIPASIVYDVPTNNSPVRAEDIRYNNKAAVIIMSSSLREMTKKYSGVDTSSAPDVSTIEFNSLQCDSSKLERRNSKPPAPRPPPRPPKKSSSESTESVNLNASATCSHLEVNPVEKFVEKTDKVAEGTDRVAKETDKVATETDKVADKTENLAEKVSHCDARDSLSDDENVIESMNQISGNQEQSPADATSSLKMAELEKNAPDFESGPEMEDLVSQVVSIIESKVTELSKAMDCVTSGQSDDEPLVNTNIILEPIHRSSVIQTLDYDDVDIMSEDAAQRIIAEAFADIELEDKISDSSSDSESDIQLKDEESEVVAYSVDYCEDYDNQHDHTKVSQNDTTKNQVGDIQTNQDGDTQIHEDGDTQINQDDATKNHDPATKTHHVNAEDNQEGATKIQQIFPPSLQTFEVIEILHEVPQDFTKMSTEHMNECPEVQDQSPDIDQENKTGPTDDKIISSRPEFDNIKSVSIPATENQSPPLTPLSEKSVDIDSLEVLSEIASNPSSESTSVPTSPLRKSQDPLVIDNPVDQASIVIMETSVPTEMFAPKEQMPSEELETEDGSHFYDDVPLETAEELKINYAAISQNDGSMWETVEETEEDEVYELYDDFPSDCFPIAPRSTIQMDTSAAVVAKDVLRQSGINQLQDYLATEEHHHHHVVGTSTTSSAINRLGHSSAIAQLKQLINDS